MRGLRREEVCWDTMARELIQQLPRTRLGGVQACTAYSEDSPIWQPQMLLAKQLRGHPWRFQVRSKSIDL